MEKEGRIIFISGSINIKELPEKIKKTIDKIISKSYKILVGDANGLDSEIQQYLHNREYNKVKVYCVGDALRNNKGSFRVKKINYKQTDEYKNMYKKEKDKIDKYDGRSRQKFKDKAMIEDANYYLCVWDGHSQGTKDNIIGALDKLSKTNGNVENIQVYYLGESSRNEKGVLEIDYTKGRFLKKEEKNKEEVNKVFESKVGIIAKVLRERFNKIFQDNQDNGFNMNNIPDKSLKSEFEELEKLKPAYLKENFKKYVIQTYYKGKKSTTKYNPAILEVLIEKKEVLIGKLERKQTEQIFFNK